MIGYVWLEMLTIISLVFFLFFTRREMNCWAGLELQVVSKSDFTVQIYQKHCLFYVNMVAIYEVTILVVNVILLCSLQLRKSNKVLAASSICVCVAVCWSALPWSTCVWYYCDKAAQPLWGDWECQRPESRTKAASQHLMEWETHSLDAWPADGSAWEPSRGRRATIVC